MFFSVGGLGLVFRMLIVVCFVLNKKSLNVRFRGSTNQRVIDVAKSLASNEVVLYYED